MSKLDDEFERLRVSGRIAPGLPGLGLPDWTHGGVESLPDFFNNTAHLWDAKFERKYANLHRAVAARIPTTDQTVSILDVGCGTGLELQYVFERAPNARVTAMDQSPRMLAELCAKYAARAEQIRPLEASCTEWPSKLTGFDYVLSILCVHHFPPPAKSEVYASFLSALKPGGLYIEGDQVTSKEHEAKLLHLFDAWISKLPGGNRGEWNFDVTLSIESNQRLLAEAGFSDSVVVWSAEGHAVTVANH